MHEPRDPQNSDTENMGGPYRLDPINARYHGPESKAAIDSSFDEVGAFGSIEVDGEDIVRAGNGVYERAVARGWKIREVVVQPDEIIAVKRPDLTGVEAQRAGILHNRTAEVSTWSEPNLSELQGLGVKVDDLWTPDQLSSIGDIGELEYDPDRARGLSTYNAGATEFGSFIELGAVDVGDAQNLEAVTVGLIQPGDTGGFVRGDGSNEIDPDKFEEKERGAKPAAFEAEAKEALRRAGAPAILEGPTHAAYNHEVWGLTGLKGSGFDGLEHLLVVADPMTEASQYAKYLAGENVMAFYHGGPHVPFIPKARTHMLVIVQPDPVIAGYILDAYAAAYGEGMVKCLLGKSKKQAIT